MCTLGSAFGAIFSGPVAKIGRMNSILLTNLVAVIGSGLVLIQNEICLLIGRFIYGLACGSFSVFVPLYINETAPIELKGPMGVMT